MLEVLLSSTKKKEKMQQLEGYGVKMTTELEGCVSDMCNISEAILERALEEGLEKGLEQGIEQGIEINDFSIFNPYIIIITKLNILL